MLRVLAQGLRELGLDPGACLPREATLGATVSLHQKRQLVASAVAQGGLGCLVLLGRGLHRLADEPTHRALVSARDAQDLLSRWGRLERYIHSRHCVEVLSVDAHGARLAHRSRAGSPPPLPAEDLVVLGVLVALLEAIGAADTSARVGTALAYPVPDAAALQDAARCGHTAVWSISWSRITAPPRPTAVGVRPFGQQVAAPPLWSAQARRAFLALCEDLTLPLNLPALASLLGQAPRSLQRDLKRDATSYTQLLGEARCRSASWWLLNTTTPVAEVGYLCGYADQPHFTRDFRQRVGMTPTRYRTEFLTQDGASDVQPGHRLT
jgi:AraC-like DNA-binding protein